MADRYLSFATSRPGAALVTGAAPRIGATVAEVLHRDGARVIWPTGSSGRGRSAPAPGSGLRVALTAARPHHRGSAFDVVAEATADAGGSPVWRSVSIYLHRDRTAAPGARRRQDDPHPGPALTRLTVPAATGRRYAAVSGDRNPIHLHPLTARPFGFRRAIAHGMWTKARCLAALDRAEPLPDAFTVAVTFHARCRSRPTSNCAPDRATAAAPSNCAPPTPAPSTCGASSGPGLDAIPET